MNAKQIISEFLVQCNKSELVQYLEYPLDLTMWDVALPCFMLAKELKQSPMQIAQNLAEVLKSQIKVVENSWEEINYKLSQIDDVISTGPYINFTINWAVLGEELIQEIKHKGNEYGKWEIKKDLILVESPGPNTNKPLHLGHVRNMLLGNSVADILLFAGYNVKKVDIVNDRGIHICKSMLAYQKLGNKAQPNKKSDHYVWDRYIAYDAWLADHHEWELEIKEMLVAWENGDEQVRSLWKQMNKRCLDWHAQTYARYGTVIDKMYLESDHYLAGKKLVMDGLEQWLFRRNDKGNVVADLSASGGAEKVLLRSDDTSIYMTQDLALGVIRYEDYHMDRMIYVVGSEQDEHFRSLFELFGRMWYNFADQCYHLSYGMISLPDGKMKSRTGNVVDADNLADDMYTKCVELLVERYCDLDHHEVARRAEVIAMAAIKLFILKYDAKKNFVFDKDHSLAFDGETGPYILYSYARAKTILSKSELQGNNSEFLRKDKSQHWNIFEITIEEKVLLWMIAKFGEIVQESAIDYAPTVVAKYVLWLASLFNSYYHHTKILDVSLDENVRDFRLWLVSSVAQVLQNGLKLLWIETLEQM